jgi:hypothetical protein
LNKGGSTLIIADDSGFGETVCAFKWQKVYSKVMVMKNTFLSKEPMLFIG